MTLLLGVLLLVFPWLELWLMFSLGQALAVIVLQGVATAAVGAWFARKEALSLWAELESDIRNGRVPTEEGLDAMMEVLGGWMLVIPGWITDLAGGAMVVPAVRRVLMTPIRNAIRDHLI
ncbi:MAG: FxsA family protein [bacterium]